MDKQRPVNKVAHNDEYSSALIGMYTEWMGGDCFQGSYIPEAFEGMDPQSHGAEVEEITKKKKKTDKKEKSVAESTCAKCGKSPCGCGNIKLIKKEELESKLDSILAELSELTESTYTVTHEKWELTKEDYDPQGPIVGDVARRKKVSKIVAMTKRGN